MLTLPRIKFVRTGLLLTGAMLTLPMIGTATLQAQGTGAAPPKKGAVVAAPLALTVKTDQPTYKADSAIRFMLTAKNTTQQELLVRFNNGQRYDFELFRGKDAKGEKVWQWSKGMMFNMMVSATKVQPGKTLEYTQTYHAGSAGMPALTPGAYTVVATLKGLPKTDAPASPLSTAVTFKVN